MSFIEQLKRRHVDRAAIVYVLAAWGLIQVVAEIFPAFGLDESGFRLLIIALAIGFVPVVLLSWFVKITPSGIFRDVESGESTERAKYTNVDFLIWAALFVALSYIVIDHVIKPEPRATWTISTPTSLVSTAGSEFTPALSPDGNFIAYALAPTTSISPAIVARAIDGTDPVSLTDTDADELGPAWSPDGTSIAFLRRRDLGGWDVVIKPFPVGVERIVHSTAPEVRSYKLDWSPDGDYLLIPDRDPAAAQRTEALFRLSLIDGRITQLTHPASDPESANGEPIEDGWPRISPDGSLIAFVRRIGVRDLICVLNTIGGAVRCLNRDDLIAVWDHDWLPDSKNLAVVTGSPDGTNRILQYLSTDSGKYFKLSNTPNISEVSTARHKNVLVSAVQMFNRDLMRLNGPAAGSAGASINIAVSNQDESWAHIHPDGRQVAFSSNRTGKSALWIAPVANHGSARLVHEFNIGFNFPRWSPNGTVIAFTGEPYEAEAENGRKVPIDAIDVDGGFPRRIVDNGFVPTWSGDGKWIYHNSPGGAGAESCDRGTPIFRSKVNGGKPELLIKCGLRPIEGPDQRLYFTDLIDGSKLKSVSIGGNDFRTEVDKVEFVYWDLSRNHLVYVDGEDSVLKVRNLKTGVTRDWAAPFIDGGIPRDRSKRSLSVSLDDNWIIYTREDDGEVDLLISDLSTIEY